MKNERSLKDLTDQMEEGYRWLARKKDGWLFTFKEIPQKINGDWNTCFDVEHEAVESRMSDFYSTITSDDEKPTDLVVFLVIKATEGMS